MKYASRTVRCNEPGLTQEQALASLYSHYGDDIRVSSVKRRGDAWVVAFDQKIAEFPPRDDAESEVPEAPAPKKSEPADPDAPTDDEGDDEGPVDLPAEPGAGPPTDGPDEKKDPQGEILHLLHEIATALGVSGGLHDKLGPEGEHPGPVPPGPDGGPEAGPEMGDLMGGGPDLGGGPGGGMPTPPKKPTKLRPGEVLPNQTPIGAPAFASTAATVTVESEKVDPRTYKASTAQAELENAFPGYRVKQIKFDRTASVYRALLSIH